MKKGQVTVIIIMAVLMITIFLTMNYLSTSRTTAVGEQSQQRQRLTQTSMEPIKEYVTSCLELATKEGLELIGAQGGYLFESQGGMVPDFGDDEYGDKFVRHEDQIVSYAINAPKSGYSAANIFFADVPKYPYVTYPELTEDRIFWGGYFGTNNLVNPFPPWEYSAEEQLEIYIMNRVQECVEWDKFAMEKLNVTPGDAFVNVTLAREETIALLDYPLNITEINTGIRGDMKTFRSSAPVRLRYLLEFMNIISDKDVSLSNYSISTARQRGITTQLIFDVHEGDYIVRLKDEQSKILDKPYLFQFMVHNRPPALHLWNNTADAPTVNNFVVCSAEIDRVDHPAVIRITPNNKLIIQNAPPCDQDVLEVQLNATEPDEQNVTFNFQAYEKQEHDKGPQNIASVVTRRLKSSWADPMPGGEHMDMGWLKVNVSVTDGYRSDNQVIHFKTHFESVTT